MSAALFARFALVAALVFSQTLSASHGIAHDSGKQSGCHICLQASSAGAAVPSTGLAPFIENHAPGPAQPPLAAFTYSTFPKSHPSRAPPSLSL